MKIKIKIKHMVILLLAISGCITLMYSFVIPKIELHAAEKQFQNGQFESKEKIRKAIDRSSGKQKWQLIRDYMIEPGPHSISTDYDVYIGPGSSQVNGTGQDRQSFSWIEKLPYLGEYLQNAPVDGYLIRSAKQLAYFYNGEGQLKAALQALELGEQRLEGSRQQNQQQELMLERAILYMQYDELDKAEQLMEQLSEQSGANNTYIINKIAQMRAQILLRHGNLNAALTTITAELEEYEKSLDYKTQELLNGPSRSVMLDSLISFRDHLKYVLSLDQSATATVTGQVKRSDGSPLPYVGIFLREQSAVNHSVVEGEPYQTTTDQAGNYTFEGVIPGSYQLYLGLKFEQIDGWTWPVESNEWLDIEGNEIFVKNIVIYPLLELATPVNQQIVTGETIDFQWEQVEGAAYYNLNMGLQIGNSSISAAVRTHITENRLRLSLEQLYDLRTGLMFSTRDDGSSVEPLSLIGFANPDTRFSWSIGAYDAGGNLLTRSNGYRLNEETFGNLPFFYVKERTLTPADQLLLDRQMDEALAEYKKTYAADPDDIHSLRMIIRMLGSKALVNDREKFEDEALPYLKQMVKTNPTESYRSSLMDYYYTREDWDTYNEQYAEYAKMRQQPLDPYVQSIHATALMKQGQIEEAMVEFEQAMQRDGSHRFIGNYLAVTLYSTGSYDSVLKLATKYPERSGAYPDRNWVLLVNELKHASEHTARYDEELNEKLEMYFHGETDTLKQWFSMTKQSEMKAFIQALLEIR